MCWLIAATPKLTGPTPVAATTPMLPAIFIIRGDGTSLMLVCRVMKITNARELPAQPAKDFAAGPHGRRGHSWFSDCQAPFDTCPTELFAPDS